MARVLVGVVTYDGHSYAFNALMESFRAFTSPVDILFIDTSATDEYAKSIMAKGFGAVHVGGEGTKIERIVRGRNRLRQECLDQGYDYLFFIDSDVICPPEGLSRLLAIGKPVTTGVYLHVKKHEGKAYMMAVLYAPHGPGLFRTMEVAEVLDDKVIPVAGAGLGCCFISREVLEKIPFRFGNSSTSGEDDAFFKDVMANGFQLYADTGVKCFHMAYPEGERRNQFYRFEHWAHLKK